MIDANELMRRLKRQGGDAQMQAALERLQTMLQNNDTSMHKNIDSATAARIERAAHAAQAGDQKAAQAAIAEIVATPEGAALAAQLRRMLGQ